VARPPSFDTTRAVETMLAAFWRHGYAATTIPQLVSATGLLPGSLYAAFGSKDEMFRRAIEHYVAWLAAQLPSTRGLTGIADTLATLVRLTISDRQRRGCPMLNAIAEADRLSPRTRRELDEGFAAMRALFRARLVEAHAPAAKLDELEAVLFSAAVSIRVLGRARADDALLQHIAGGALAAARRSIPTRRPRR
jgi:TetR/AcrR family transcriptional repressor of nem operon